MRKKIGILGGISPVSTIRYYQLMLENYMYNKEFSFPEILIYSIDFKKFTHYENTDRSAYIDYIAEGLKVLEKKSGSGFILMAANSPHSIFHVLESRIKYPILHICKPVAHQAIRLQLTCLLLLGIKHTMHSNFYADFLKPYELKVITPDVGDQEIMDSIILMNWYLNVLPNIPKEELQTL